MAGERHRAAVIRREIRVGRPRSWRVISVHSFILLVGHITTEVLETHVSAETSDTGEPNHFLSVLLNTHVSAETSGSPVSTHFLSVFLNIHVSAETSPV